MIAFKAPSSEELDHDYLWRAHKAIPERGKIGLFNRSYYEEVLVVRVHENILAAQHLPGEVIKKDIWEKRYQDINNFEKYLFNNGVVILKFFLHLSKNEQKKRFLERLEMPEKNWKFSLADIKERDCWKDYLNAYEEMIQNTASKHALEARCARFGTVQRSRNRSENRRARVSRSAAARPRSAPAYRGYPAKRPRAGRYGT